jgi:signal transduction histidine kinase
VSLVTDSGRAILSVTDTGIGISPSDLPHIFDRFYRADPSRSQVEGNGLGLSIAKWIADMHHAEISAVSEPHRGTILRVVFPLCVT